MNIYWQTAQRRMRIHYCTDIFYYVSHPQSLVKMCLKILDLHKYLISLHQISRRLWLQNISPLQIQSYSANTIQCSHLLIWIIKSTWIVSNHRSATFNTFCYFQSEQKRAMNFNEGNETLIKLVNNRDNTEFLQKCVHCYGCTLGEKVFSCC